MFLLLTLIPDWQKCWACCFSATIQAEHVDNVFSILSLVRRAVICHVQESEFLSLHRESKLEIPNLFPIGKRRKYMAGANGVTGSSLLLFHENPSPNSSVLVVLKVCGLAGNGHRYISHCVLAPILVGSQKYGPVISHHTWPPAILSVLMFPFYHLHTETFPCSCHCLLCPVFPDCPNQMRFLCSQHSCWCIFTALVLQFQHCL